MKLRISGGWSLRLSGGLGLACESFFFLGQRVAPLPVLRAHWCSGPVAHWAGVRDSWLLANTDVLGGREAEKPQARALSSPPFLVTFIGTLPNTFQDTILLIFPISWGRRVYYYYTHFLSEETEACASRDPACKWRARGGNLNHSASVPPTPWALPPPLLSHLQPRNPLDRQEP